jgi:DNA-binding response OmpR family regulator
MAKKILLVEDTAETRDILTILLEIQGFDVVVANDGYDGIKNTFAENPDLIITDLTMPRLDGVEMIKILRSVTDWKHVPILAVTAYGTEVAEKAIEAGANRALSQPVDADVLLNLVNELLKKKRARARKASHP